MAMENFLCVKKSENIATVTKYLRKKYIIIRPPFHRYLERLDQITFENLD